MVRGYYHGTTMDAALSICRDGFIPHDKKHYWAGKGVYFFEDAPVLAQRWAGEITRRRGETTPAVVRSLIEFRNCMNLLDEAWNERIREARRLLPERCSQAGITMPIQTGIKEQLVLDGEIGGFHYVDCAVINDAIAYWDAEHKHKTICSVRALFLEGTALYENAHFFTRSHVAIVVRDISVITHSRLTP